MSLGRVRLNCDAASQVDQAIITEASKKTTRLHAFEDDLLWPWSGMAPLQPVERSCSLPSLKALRKPLMLHDSASLDHDSLGLVHSVAMNLPQ